MYISFARVLKLYFLFIELLKFPSLLFYRDYTETRRTTETISIQIIAWLEQIKVLEIFQAFERKKEGLPQLPFYKQLHSLTSIYVISFK